MGQVKDPVNGQVVDSATARKSSYQGNEYVFSSDDSKREFDANPEKYARQGANAGSPGMNKGNAQQGGQQKQGGQSGQGDRWGSEGGRSDQQKQTSTSSSGKDKNPGGKKGM